MNPYVCTTALDALSWAESLTVSSFGLSVRIQLTDPSALSLVKAILPPHWEPSAAGNPDLIYSLVSARRGTRVDCSPRYTAYAGPSAVAESPDLEVALRALESRLHLDLADQARDRVFVHAGVVGCRGRAILLPGRSMAGKTTLVARLIEAGCSYYSDEFAVLDGHGLVHPYARPLSVRQAPGAQPRRMGPEAFGGEPGLEPIPAGLVLLSKYRPGSTFRPRRLSSGRAALGLMDNTVPIRRDPERSLSALVAVAKAAPCWRGWRGDAAEVVSFVMVAASSW